MIATQDIRLGGQHSLELIGPTPIGLVPMNVPVVQMVAPPNPLPPSVAE